MHQAGSSGSGCWKYYERVASKVDHSYGRCPQNKTSGQFGISGRSTAGPSRRIKKGAITIAMTWPLHSTLGYALLWLTKKYVQAIFLGSVKR